MNPQLPRGQRKGLGMSEPFALARLQWPSLADLAWPKWDHRTNIKQPSFTNRIKADRVIRPGFLKSTAMAAFAASPAACSVRNAAGFAQILAQVTNRFSICVLLVVRVPGLDDRLLVAIDLAKAMSIYCRGIMTVFMRSRGSCNC